MHSVDMISLIAFLWREQNDSRTLKFCILFAYVLNAVHILVFLLCYCTFVKNWWGTHSIFVRYVRYNLIVSHCHDWNCWRVNNVACLLYQYIRDYLCNTFHIPHPGDVLVIPFKSEAEGVCTWLSCCYCMLSKNITVTKFADFSVIFYLL